MNVAPRPCRCSVAEFRLRSRAERSSQAEPCGVSACVWHQRTVINQQLPADGGHVWLRLLTSLSGHKAAGGHSEVGSDGKSGCWQEQLSFISHAAASGFCFLHINTSEVSGVVRSDRYLKVHLKKLLHLQHLLLTQDLKN